MFKILKRFIMNQIFLPIKTVADLNEIEPIHIMNIYYKNKKDERFKLQDGKLLVIDNYRYPFAQEVESLRNKALIIARTETHLCKELEKISDFSFYQLNKYFYRFTFKQIKLAKQIIQLLKKYIKQNSLFPEEELSYEY